MHELQEDCDRLNEERAHLKRQSVLEKQAQQHLAQELTLQNAELSRARDQVQRWLPWGEGEGMSRDRTR